ncbi:MAG: hypothetical protein ACRC30_07795 [Clostridium sp.]
MIGYENIGESIIFFIYQGKKIVYSGVVDSYETDYNKTIEILEKNNVKKLDFICWTHPDEDHSIGIDKLLLRFTDNKTKVIIPENISGEEYEYNERITETFKIIEENLKSRKKDTFTIRSASDNKILEYFTFDRGALGKEEFKIVSIAPNSQVVRKDEFNKGMKKNDYSIALIITLGYFTILLSGDIENKTIAKLDWFSIPEIIDYIKIPHHASSSSNKLLDIIGNFSCGVACTTTYKNGSTKLPDSKIIELYRNKAKNLYCVGKKDKDDDQKYGIFELECDILSKSLYLRLEGNAYPIYTE